MSELKNLIKFYDSALQNTLFKIPKDWPYKLVENFLLVKYSKNNIF